MFECCDKQRIKDVFLDRDPTNNDTQINSYTYVVNTKTGDLFFKTKDASGNPKITKLSGGGGGGGSGIQKIIIDDVTLEPEADGSVTLKGDLVQGVQVIADGG